jgi:hypothetical protein
MLTEHWWEDEDRGQLKEWEKNLSYCHPVYHKSHSDWPGAEQVCVVAILSSTCILENLEVLPRLQHDRLLPDHLHYQFKLYRLHILSDK